MTPFVQGQTVVLTRTNSPKEKEILGKPLTVLRKSSTGYHIVCRCENVPGAWWLDPDQLKSLSENPKPVEPEPRTFSDVSGMELQTMDEWQMDQRGRTY